MLTRALRDKWLGWKQQPPRAVHWANEPLQGVLGRARLCRAVTGFSGTMSGFDGVSPYRKGCGRLPATASTGRNAMRFVGSRAWGWHWICLTAKTEPRAPISKTTLLWVSKKHCNSTDRKSEAPKRAAFSSDPIAPQRVVRKFGGRAGGAKIGPVI